MTRGLKWSLALNALLCVILAFILFNDGSAEKASSAEKTVADVLRPTHYEQRATLFASLPITTSDVVMLGDSMILYNEWDEEFPKINVINRGIGGDTTHGLLRRLSDVTVGQPQTIVLMVGTNDLSMHVSEKEIIENYNLIIDRIHQESPNTKIVMTSVLPINKTIRKSKVQNEQIIALNKQLTKVAENQQLPIVQLYDTYLKDGQLDAKYTSDGLHLNGAGYRIWVKQLTPYLIIE